MNADSRPSLVIDTLFRCGECSNPALWKVTHREYADHLSPNFACGQHLSRVCREGEYGEGDEFIVRRVKFDC